MNNKLDIIYSSVTTRIFYVIAILMIIGPMFSKISRVDRLFKAAEVKGITIELFIGLFTHIVALAVIILLGYRIIMVIINKAKLEFIKRDRYIFILRQFGLVIIYIGVIGYLFTIIMTFIGGGAFLIFGVAFKYVMPLGLLIFEASRIFSYERV